VSFSRLGQLDDVNVDLSEALLQAQQRKEQQQLQQQQRQQAAASASPASSSSAAARPRRQQQPLASASPAAPAAPSSSPSYQFKDLPTKNEARRFRRTGRLAAPGTVASLSAVGQPSAEEAAARAVAAAAERARYEQLKVAGGCVLVAGPVAWRAGRGLCGGVRGVARLAR
jgi:hypothetical protein